MFRISSQLDQEYKQDLEELLFFNPGQRIAHSGIVESIKNYGEPFIHYDGASLRIKTTKLDQVQVLFALDGEILAGVMLYSRISAKELAVIHIAAKEEYSSRGNNAQKMLILQMSTKLRRCAGCISGIEIISISYGGSRTRIYPIRRRSTSN